MAGARSVAIGRLARLVFGPGVASSGEATLVLGKLGELQGLHRCAQITWVRLDLIFLGATVPRDVKIVDSRRVRAPSASPVPLGRSCMPSVGLLSLLVSAFGPALTLEVTFLPAVVAFSIPAGART